MKKEKCYSIDDLFNRWLGFLRTEANDIRYLHQHRPEILEGLIGMFVKYNVSYEDAKLYKRKVVLALTTDEGRKGTGKYRGWKECVEEDFLGVLANFYIENVQDDEIPDNKMRLSSKETVETRIEPNRYHPDNTVITEWAKDKFGQDWTPEINKEAHLVGGIINIQFQEEVFESDWILNPNEYPQWYIKACRAA